MSVELECLIDFTGTAAWRRRKADQHPEDTRNLDAAETLERLAIEARGLKGSDAHLSLCKAWEKSSTEEGVGHVNEAVSEALRSVGFGYKPTSAKALVDDLVATFAGEPQSQAVN